MALTSDQITAQNFADFYTTIKPYLNGGGFKMTKLWENLDPTQTMGSGVDIALSSSDYDLLVFIAKYQNDVDRYFDSVVMKGQTVQLATSNASNVINRVLTYTTDTKYVTASGYVGNSVNNALVIPIAVYGIKLYAYDNISCVMMSSTWEAGQTTVEFTDPIIDGDSIFDVYLPSQYADLIYSSLSVSGHTLTITFPSAQASDIEVKLRVNRG